MTVIGATVAVWTAPGGVPERIVFNGERYRVTDTPTLLEPDIWFVTHPPALPPAWRFQGTTDAGDSRVFDVRFDAARAQWQLLHIYE